MAQPPPTILSLKQSFLETQIRLLSRPLEPDQTWHDQNAASVTTLPPSSVDDALLRLNQALQQHTRRVYPPQSTRIVAEQIDKLYHPDQTPLDEDSPEDNTPPKQGADLTSAPTITALPAPWPLEADTQAHPMESARYTDLAASLTSLSARRTEALDRVQRLRRIRAALRPFAPDDAPDGAALQDNLVTRDGQVEKELEKMRMLLVRVGGRVAALPGAARGPDDDAMLVDSPAAVQRRKVDGLMDLF